jgi:hypothetical protein
MPAYPPADAEAQALAAARKANVGAMIDREFAKILTALLASDAP